MRLRALVVGLGLLIVAGLVWFAQHALQRSVTEVVALEAEREAEAWASYFINQMPDLAGLMRTGRPTPAQAERIALAAEAGDVFRFDLLSRAGRPMLSSWRGAGDNAPEGATPRAEPEDHGDHAAEEHAHAGASDADGHADEVIATGRTIVHVARGTKTGGMPELYAVAHVPARDAAGATLGVIEVYVDRTATAALFTATFSQLAALIAGVLVVAFSTPYAAFLVRSYQERHSRQRADFLSRYDELTRVFNRPSLMEELKRRLSAIEQSEVDLACLFIDLDHFKAVNDTFGHKAGDAFLRAVGEAIRREIGPTDFAGRLGGDEFVVIAERRGLSAVVHLAERLQAAIGAPLRVDGATIVGHASIGIHFGPVSKETVEDWMHKADIALYQAKLDGRDTHRVFVPDLEVKILRRREVEAAILTGLDEGRFDLHFQPLLDEKSRRVAGFEALLRLKDRNGTAITPAEFIPVAEEMGAIKRLGSWVIERAAAVAADWPEELIVAVNLSPRQFDEGTLVPTVQRVLEETGLAPHRLELEVTESLLMRNTEAVAEQLGALAAMGISLAMDDFGTGYSSLGYLWQFRFNKLKVDRSFVAGLQGDGEKARSILETIIMLGHRLDMTVTAEGVETPRQAELLGSMGFDQVQGYLFGRPLPADELPGFILGNFREVVGSGNEGREQKAAG